MVLEADYQQSLSRYYALKTHPCTGVGRTPSYDSNMIDDMNKDI